MTTGVRRGDIRNSDYAWKAKQYSWSRISDLFPRNISPTDIDACFELNSHFLAVEFKTVGKSIDRGQRLFFDRWLYSFRERAVLFICEHQQLEFVDTTRDVLSMSVWAWDNAAGGIIKTNMMTVDAPGMKFWFSEFAKLAEGQANSFRRGIREAIGVYPQSVLKDFTVIGGEVWLPPYTLSPGKVKQFVPREVN